MSDTYERGESLGCPDCATGEPHVCPFLLADQSPAREQTLAHLREQLPIEELIERSSLGTPGAKAIRARTPKHVVDEIMRRAGYTTDEEE